MPALPAESASKSTRVKIIRPALSFQNPQFAGFQRVLADPDSGVSRCAGIIHCKRFMSRTASEKAYLHGRVVRFSSTKGLGPMVSDWMEDCIDLAAVRICVKKDAAE